MFATHPTIALDPIPGFPGYLANRLGIIFSVKTRDRLARPLNLHQNDKGYLRVFLRLNKCTSRRYVHRLILETFVGPCPLGMECLHGPGGKLDNSIGNLRWGTPIENRLDWNSNGNGKLGPADIPAIRVMRPADAARKYGISRQHVWAIKNRFSWEDIP
jgi:hypothetical protein